LSSHGRFGREWQGVVGASGFIAGAAVTSVAGPPWGALSSSPSRLRSSFCPSLRLWQRGCGTRMTGTTMISVLTFSTLRPIEPAFAIATAMMLGAALVPAPARAQPAAEQASAAQTGAAVIVAKATNACFSDL